MRIGDDLLRRALAEVADLDRAEIGGDDRPALRRGFGSL